MFATELGTRTAVYAYYSQSESRSLLEGVTGAFLAHFVYQHPLFPLREMESCPTCECKL